MRRKPKVRPRRDGRPTDLTPELQEKLCDEIRRARTVAEACRAAGISEATFFRWQAKGAEEPVGAHRGFREAVAQAKAQRIEALEDHVVRAARSDWRAALEMLRVYEPKRFLPRVRAIVFDEFTRAADQLEAEFHSEPDVLERATRAITGNITTDEVSLEAAGGAGVDPGAAIVGGGAVDAGPDVNARDGG